MRQASLTIRRFSDNTAGFSLWSSARRLLLIGDCVPSYLLDDCIDDFVRHAGIAQCYREIGNSASGYRLALTTPDGRLIAQTPLMQTRGALDELRGAAMREGPCAEIEGHGPPATPGRSQALRQSVAPPPDR